MNYYIYADVSIDIDMEFARENDIRFVPMAYMLGDDAFNCTEPETDETMHVYYEKLRHKVPTKTSQITPNSYVEIFEPAVREGIPILYLALSSGLSDTYSSARMAVQLLQEEYDNDSINIEIVDSYGATGGMGLLAEAAVANRKNGMSISENADWLRAHSRNILYWFKVEDLMYLMRGGRVSATTAIVGTALNIKPILTVNHEGKLDTIDKKRGNKQAVNNLIERFTALFHFFINAVKVLSPAENFALNVRFF